MADVLADLQSKGIFKRILFGGTGDLPQFKDGTKLYFHYRTTKCDDEKTLLDDSRKHSKPMELIVGKKFKLEVWETCLVTMRQKEVAEFGVTTAHAASYPLVAKSLRDIFEKNGAHSNTPKHCCGMMAMSEEGVGYPDLNELMKTPQPLMFTLELLKVENPGEYEKESWVMTEDEKLKAIPNLKEEGNAYYKQKQYTEAAEKYGEALGMLEQLVLKEKPGEKEWDELEDKKTPFLLNFAQCKLLLNEFYPVIEHTTTVLARDPDNVKALFRRAKAHVGAWNPKDAKIDFERVMELDDTLTAAVQKELKSLAEKEHQKDMEDKQKLKKLFS
ncbi:AH receptor-interacting protein-like isoform X2 [Mizuhopecten yessoensis]|uniref:AH receptor-interacting protein-like isoform X2 n=1 Tax=Mizuhopecten yessoensis TaxID=6573 RepID=UPI000B45BBDC|nr:AH receptor-interacting protein-like isoform X2 [Mizuhopecten yessoensis]